MKILINEDEARSIGLTEAGVYEAKFTGTLSYVSPEKRLGVLGPPPTEAAIQIAPVPENDGTPRTVYDISVDTEKDRLRSATRVTARVTKMRAVVLSADVISQAARWHMVEEETLRLARCPNEIQRTAIEDACRKALQPVVRDVARTILSDPNA